MCGVLHDCSMCKFIRLYYNQKSTKHGLGEVRTPYCTQTYMHFLCRVLVHMHFICIGLWAIYWSAIVLAIILLFPYSLDNSFQNEETSSMMSNMRIRGKQRATNYSSSVPIHMPVENKTSRSWDEEEEVEVSSLAPHPTSPCPTLLHPAPLYSTPLPNPAPLLGLCLRSVDFFSYLQ